MPNNETIVRERGDNDKSWSENATVDCSVEPDLTRQEDKAGADIHTILRRFNATGQLPPLRQPNYGEKDFDVQMQDAFIAVEAAQEVYNKLPQGVKNKYPDWKSMLAAVENGELKRDMIDPDYKEPETPPTPTPDPTPPA